MKYVNESREKISKELSKEFFPLWMVKNLIISALKIVTVPFYLLNQRFKYSDISENKAYETVVNVDHQKKMADILETKKPPSKADIAEQTKEYVVDIFVRLLASTVLLPITLMVSIGYAVSIIQREKIIEQIVWVPAPTPHQVLITLRKAHY